MNSLDVLSSACEAILASPSLNAFWLPSVLTGQSFEEGARNAAFAATIATFERSGASPSLMASLRLGINGNLAQALGTNRAVSRVTRNPSRAPDIEFCVQGQDSWIESKMVFDYTLEKYYSRVADDREKLHRHRTDGRCLFQVVFFLGLPHYYFPPGAWMGRSGRPARTHWVNRSGIDSQFDRVSEAIGGSPTWPSNGLYRQSLCPESTSDTALLIRRWISNVFVPDSPWEFDLSIHLRDAEVGVAIWEYL